MTSQQKILCILRISCSRDVKIFFVPRTKRSRLRVVYGEGSKLNEKKNLLKPCNIIKQKPILIFLKSYNIENISMQMQKYSTQRTEANPQGTDNIAIDAAI